MGALKLVSMNRLFALLVVAVVASTPVYTSFAEMQATPVVEPTPSPEPTPNEVAPATPDYSEDDMVEPYSIEPTDVPVDSENSLTGCIQSSETVPPGGTVSITCDFTIGAGYVGSPIAQVTRPALTGGFSASINIADGTGSASLPPGGSQSELSMLLGSPGEDGARTAQITILLGAPVDASAGDEFSWEFTACRAAATGGCNDHESSVEIGLTVDVDELNLVDGIHYSAECTQPEPAVVGFGERVVSTCSVTAGDIDFAQLMLNDLVTTLNGSSGWSGRLVSIEGDEPVPTGTIPGLYRVDPAPMLSEGETFRWEIWLEPVACSASDSTLTLGVRGNITPVDSEGERLGPTITASPRTITVDFTQPETSAASAALAASPEIVNVPYSMTSDQEGSAALRLQFTVEGCEPWDGYIEMTPFMPADESHVGPVPELESVSHGDTTQSGPGYTHIDLPPITTLGSTPTQVIEGTEPGMEVQINHELNLEYTIPANTPVGEYTSTITVTTSDAP